MGPHITPEAVNALIEALDDPKYVQVSAGALGSLGPQAKTALPRLMEIQNNPEAPSTTRFFARQAIEKIDLEARPTD